MSDENGTEVILPSDSSAAAAAAAADVITPGDDDRLWSSFSEAAELGT
jgi:hypothetical protein